MLIYIISFVENVIAGLSRPLRHTSSTCNCGSLILHICLGDPSVLLLFSCLLVNTKPYCTDSKHVPMKFLCLFDFFLLKYLLISLVQRQYLERLFLEQRFRTFSAKSSRLNDRIKYTTCTVFKNKTSNF